MVLSLEHHDLRFKTIKIEIYGVPEEGSRGMIAYRNIDHLMYLTYFF